jgi:hypothetical protein
MTLLQKAVARGSHAPQACGHAGCSLPAMLDSTSGRCRAHLHNTGCRCEHCLYRPRLHTVGVGRWVEKPVTLAHRSPARKLYRGKPL